MDIVVWLRSLGLGRYEAAFRDNEIDETVLPNLTAEDLKDLGVSVVGHRRKLLDAIAALRTDAVAVRLTLDHDRALFGSGGLFENFFSSLHSHNSAPELLTQVTVTTPVSQVGRRNQAAG
jgi:hypothetical protein